MTSIYLSLPDKQVKTKGILGATEAAHCSVVSAMLLFPAGSIWDSRVGVWEQQARFETWNRSKSCWVYPSFISVFCFKSALQEQTLGERIFRSLLTKCLAGDAFVLQWAVSFRGGVSHLLLLDGEKSCYLIFCLSGHLWGGRMVLCPTELSNPSSPIVFLCLGLCWQSSCVLRARLWSQQPSQVKEEASLKKCPFSSQAPWAQVTACARSLNTQADFDPYSACRGLWCTGTQAWPALGVIIFAYLLHGKL